MENQIAELKNEIEYLKDQLTAHQLVLALLLRPAQTGNIKDDLQNLVNKLALTAVPQSEQAKLQIHLERLIDLAEFQTPKVDEQSPE
ncbi:hypothetical protein L4F91_06880 [Avibacterium sp. 20-126]|uniref:hypothetical protein n=1 Tax=Avibacterium sp. 20-126 TaxID=2911524 RepID=UPI00218AEED1|nr:hypothetical protein L4F91_06880 [Avibacterium sp. 20-126]